LRIVNSPYRSKITVGSFYRGNMNGSLQRGRIK
jgi:hypothetical protein